MSKRNITYIKPEEPSFLKRLKKEAGYKEGPTVDTKREELPSASEEDFEDITDEQPTVVVLKPGDLTAEEADEIKKKLEKETAEAPADLTERVFFRNPKLKNSGENKRSSSDTETSTKKKSGKDKKSKKTKVVLSFNDDDEEDK